MPLENPTLPLVYVDTTLPPVTGSTWNVSDAAGLQNALDNAALGDEIVVASSATITGNFVLKNKISGSGWITVRAASYPPESTRMTPGLAISYSSPRIQTPNGQPAIATENNAHHYRLIGLDITTTLASPGEQYGLVTFGTDNHTSVQVPEYLVVDRCWVHGTSTSRTRRGVALNAKHDAVINSTVDDCHDTPDDSQAIAGWNGPGPHKIVNNRLEGAGENVIFGGSDPSIPGMTIADIEIRRNHFFKPDSWAGDVWSVKNLIELKHAYRTLIEGNLFEGNWWDAQDGEWAVFVSINQNGTAPQSGCVDTTLRYNIIKNIGSGMLMGTYNEFATPFNRFAEYHNLYYRTNYSIYLASWGGGIRWHIISGESHNIQIYHNTMVNDSANGANSLLTFGVGTVVADLVCKDNICSAGVYGLAGPGVNGAAALAAHSTNPDFNNNVLYMLDRSEEMPQGTNQYVTLSLSQIGYEDVAGDNYRLSNTSNFKNDASDGTDPGADIDLIESVMNGGSPPNTDIALHDGCLFFGWRRRR